MSKRTSLTWASQLQVMRLLADVAALKHDPAAQRQFSIDSVNDLMHARCAQFIVADGMAPGKSMSLRHQALARDPDPAFVRAATEIGSAITPDSEPYVDHAMHSEETLQMWSRERVLARPDAHRRYAPTLALEDAAGVVDGTVAAYRDIEHPDCVVGLSVHRTRGSRKFRPQEQALLAFALSELYDLAKRGHLPLGPPPPAALPPRLTQVLERLLRGDGVKQIARDLDLSVWTVREYIQRLYRHFGVSSREQLMAQRLKH